MEDFDFKINLENVWLIGDSETDLQCAINSGCKPILFGLDKKNICNMYNNSINYTDFNSLYKIFD